MRRSEGQESSGFTILYGPPELSFYSNMVQGSTDSFRNRNTRLNLLALGLHGDFGGSAFHGGYGEKEFVHSPTGNNHSTAAHENNQSTDTEPEYFPASDYLSSDEDYFVSSNSPVRINALQSYGLQSGFTGDSYDPYYPSGRYGNVNHSGFEIGQSSRANRGTSQNVPEEDVSDQVPIGTLTQHTGVQDNLVVSTTSVGLQEPEPITFSPDHYHDPPVMSAQQRPNPWVGTFTSGGEPFVEGLPFIHRNGVFSPIDRNDTGVHSPASSTQQQPNLSPISSFAELSLGTFRVTAPEMEDNSDSNSSSSSIKLTENPGNVRRSGKRPRFDEGHRSHSANSACSALGFTPTDWFHKRRKLRIKRWERNGGLGMWKKRGGIPWFTSKCFTDIPLARDFGVEVNEDITSHRAKKRSGKKRSIVQQQHGSNKKQRRVVLGLQPSSRAAENSFSSGSSNASSSSSSGSSSDKTHSGLVTGFTQSPGDP